MVTVQHNMNNKDKIECTKRGVLWSHTVCLKESCLRLFDVNQCMKDRSNWPEVTLRNLHSLIMCSTSGVWKNCSLVVYNFLLHEAGFLTRGVWNNLQPLKCGLSYIAQKHVELGGHERKKKKKRRGRRYGGRRQDGRKSPNSCRVNTFVNNGIAAPNYHQMDGTERSVVAFFSHARSSRDFRVVCPSTGLISCVSTLWMHWIGLLFFHLALPAG